ncbi:unnamed protein product, partial [Cyprideis torosa]
MSLSFLFSLEVKAKGVDPAIQLLCKVRETAEHVKTDKPKKPWKNSSSESTKWVRTHKRIIHTHDVRALATVKQWLISAGMDGTIGFSCYPPKMLVRVPPFSRQAPLMSSGRLLGPGGELRDVLVNMTMTFTEDLDGRHLKSDIDLYLLPDLWSSRKSMGVTKLISVDIGCRRILDWSVSPDSLELLAFVTSRRLNVKRFDFSNGKIEPVKVAENVPQRLRKICIASGHKIFGLDGPGSVHLMKYESNVIEWICSLESTTFLTDDSAEPPVIHDWSVAKSGDFIALSHSFGSVSVVDGRKEGELSVLRHLPRLPRVPPALQVFDKTLTVVTSSGFYSEWDIVTGQCLMSHSINSSEGEELNLQRKRKKKNIPLPSSMLESIKNPTNLSNVPIAIVKHGAHRFMYNHSTISMLKPTAPVLSPFKRRRGDAENDEEQYQFKVSEHPEHKYVLHFDVLSPKEYLVVHLNPEKVLESLKSLLTLAELTKLEHAQLFAEQSLFSLPQSFLYCDVRGVDGSDPKAVEKLPLYEATEENDPDREMVFLDAKTDLERELKRNEEELRQAIAREREEEVKRSLCVSKSTDRWVGPLLPKVHERFLSGDRSLTIQDTINKHVFLKKIENQQVTFYKVACRILICRDIRRYGETLAAMRDSVISVTDALERFREEENRKFLARQVAVMVQDFWFSFHRGEVGSPSLRHFAVKFYLSLDIVNEEVGLYRERPLSNQLFNSVDEQLLRLQEESQ